MVVEQVQAAEGHTRDVSLKATKLRASGVQGTKHGSYAYPHKLTEENDQLVNFQLMRRSLYL